MNIKRLLKIPSIEYNIARLIPSMKIPMPIEIACASPIAMR